jgi:hypothetical protein
MYRIKQRRERARYQRDRERERERGRALLKMRDGVGNKFDHWRKYLWQIWEGNLKQLKIPLMMGLP